MPKPKTPYKDADSQLAIFGIKNVGYEHYRGSGVEIAGIREGDYRWRVWFSPGGRVKDCFTLSDVLAEIKAAPELAKSPSVPPAPKST